MAVWGASPGSGYAGFPPHPGCERYYVRIVPIGGPSLSVDAELVILRVGHHDAVFAPFLKRPQHAGPTPAQAFDLGVDGVSPLFALQTNRHLAVEGYPVFHRLRFARHMKNQPCSTAVGVDDSRSRVLHVLWNPPGLECVFPGLKTRWRR